MKTLIKRTIITASTVIISTVLLTNIAYAHDASKHKKANAEKPKCEAMKNVDHSKMDMNDPVMLAMMAQCTKAMQGTDTDKKVMDHSTMNKS
ncbi:MAG: hypothetical protein HRU06_13505 [Oceanospirillaceae bacterium]|nr:hypothetical protein [Oceanospirillaceae bacterium]